MSRALVLAAALASLSSPAWSAGTETCGLEQQADADTVKRIESAWLAAEYRGDVAFLDCLLDPGYAVIRAQAGETGTKAALLERVAKNKGKAPTVPPLTTIVVINGTFATAYSTMSGKKASGEAFEASFVDSYVWRDNGWYAVGGVDF